uniref:Uncharacterized protein n=1 Tax=Anopheles coluzzii TaxID=1518534 RepID=A0A8W7P2K6_ANOCL
LKAKIEKLSQMEGNEVPPTKVLVGSDYALKYLENFSTKSVDESKASVYFTPNDDEPATPEPQISPIHINYLGGRPPAALEHDDEDEAVGGMAAGKLHLGAAALAMNASHADTPKSFKSVIAGSGDIPLKSIMKPTTRFMYDKHLGKYRLCHQQPNRLSGGYADEDELAVGPELGLTVASPLLLGLGGAAVKGGAGVPVGYEAAAASTLLDGVDSADDDHHNYSLKNNRKHRRKRKLLLGPSHGSGSGGAGGSGSGGSGSASACEYETLLMKNLSHDPRESHYKIIHINKLNNGVSNSNYFGGMLGSGGTSACDSGWLAGRAVSRRHHRPTAAATAAVATSSLTAGENDYYYSLEDMIQDSNQKIRQLIYDSKIDIMNEVINTGGAGTSGRGETSGRRGHHPVKKMLHKLHFDSSTNRIQQSTSLPEIYFNAGAPPTGPTGASSRMNGATSMAEPAPPGMGSPNQTGSTISSNFSSASGSIGGRPEEPAGGGGGAQPAPKVHGGKHVILAVENSKETAAPNNSWQSTDQTNGGGGSGGGGNSSSKSSSPSPASSSSSCATPSPPASPIESNININGNGSIC